jgi:hypothetical protein
MMARKRQEPNVKVFLFYLVLAVVGIIVVYLALMNSAWVSEHIMKPIFAPIFKNFGIILK